MNITEVKHVVFDVISLFFKGATITYTEQSRKAKPQPPLVTVSFGDTHRVQHPNTQTIDGHVVAYYPSKLKVQIDLYTMGAKVKNASGGVIGLENTALSDMVDFANFLGSPYLINYIDPHNMTIATEGNVLNTTQLLNTSDYQYRATLELDVHFIQEAIGYAGILDSTSIQYPEPEAEGETEPEEGTEPKPEPEPDTGGDVVEPDGTGGNSGSDGSGGNGGSSGDTTVVPDGNTGGGSNTDGEASPEDNDVGEETEPEVLIVPTFTQNASGGGSEEVATEALGHFEEAEIENKE